MDTVTIKNQGGFMRKIYSYFLATLCAGFAVTAMAHPRFPHAGSILSNVPVADSEPSFRWPLPILVGSGTSPVTLPIDLNRADAATLRQLKGIGLKRAQAIVQYREQHGNFKQIAELGKIKGIGSKLAKKLKNKISIGDN
jgi:competence ComEA-like helix-hairpin-helix protein